MSEWTETVIGDQVNLQRGFDITKLTQRQGTVPVVSTAGVLSFHDTAMAKGPGVVLGRKGNGIGRAHLVREDYWPHDTTLWVTDFKGNDPQFVYYFFHQMFDRLQALDVGSANPTLNRNHVHPIKVNWPPLAEQKAIAGVLGALDDKIELNRRMNATLEAMARALFQSWFVDFDPVRAKLDGRHPPHLDPATAALFPDGFEESAIGHIPNGWEVVRIAEVCERIHSGGTPRREEARYWTEGAIPWLTSGEVRQPMITATESFITELGLKESAAKWVPANATVVALYGATAGQVSFLGMPATTNQAVCSLIPKPGFEYFNYFAMRNATSEMENKAVGSAQQNISKGIIEETCVLTPPAEILAKFNEAVGPMCGTWIANINQSLTLGTLRDTLLPKLLSGELRIAD